MGESHSWDRPTMTRTGGCLCGSIRYAVRGRPNNVTNCHCRMCQRAVGAAFVTWAEFPAAAVDWTRGPPRWRRSSEIGERGFCPECGTSLSFRYVGGDAVDVAVATLDDPAALPPEDELWTGSRIDWVSADGRLPQHRRGRGGTDESA